MTKRKRIILVLFTILACVGCDQVTKVIAKSHLPRNRILSFAGDTLRLDYVVNKGAVLTFEPFVPEHWQGLPFSIGVAALLGLLILSLLFASTLRPLSVAALSLLFGGILSNFLDRIAFGGDVVDFLNLGWGWLRTGIFNVADAAITSGLCLFALSILRRLRPSALRKSVQSAR